MIRQNNDQIPLGELITKARLDKHMSRAQLAKETGLSENSLIRYEKAGLETDGQFPPSPKLAQICFTLGISPLTALLSSLSHDEFWKFKSSTKDDWLQDHPDYMYLVNQWFALTRDNHKLTAILKLLLDEDLEPDSQDAEDLSWMKSEARRIIDQQDAFMKRMEDHGYLHNADSMGLTIPGNPAFDNRGPNLTTDYAEFTKNGPDQNDLDRSQKSTNETEAVEAAPTRKPKGGT